MRWRLPAHHLHFVPSALAPNLIAGRRALLDTLQYPVRIDFLVILYITVIFEAQRRSPMQIVRSKKILRAAAEIVLESLELRGVRWIEEHISNRDIQGRIAEQLDLLRAFNPIELA